MMDGQGETVVSEMVGEGEREQHSGEALREEAGGTLGYKRVILELEEMLG